MVVYVTHSFNLRRLTVVWVAVTLGLEDSTTNKNQETSRKCREHVVKAVIAVVTSILLMSVVTVDGRERNWSQYDYTEVVGCHISDHVRAEMKTAIRNERTGHPITWSDNNVYFVITLEKCYLSDKDGQTQCCLGRTQMGENYPSQAEICLTDMGKLVSSY